MLLMGLDVGTTGAKACVFSPEGELRGYGFESYDVDCPQPGYAEQDAEQVLAAALRVMRAAARESGGDIAAIGLSVQGDAVIALDADDRPVAPVQLGMDYRCVEDSDAFAARFGEQALFERTGMRPHPLNSLCKVRNFARTLPTPPSHYVTYADFILRRLGADGYCIDNTMVTRTMGVRLDTMDWDEELLAFAGATRAQMSTPTPSGVAVGALRDELADELGIRRGAKLVTGGHDQTCAAFGAGLIREDMALDSHGTAEVISSVFTRPRLERAMFEGGFPCYAHVVPGLYFTFSLNHTGGILLKWVVDNLCEGDRARAEAAGESIYSYVLRQAGEEPSRLLILPYFNGKGTPGNDLEAKGMIAGLTMAATRHDIARAVVEALCFDMRENLEALRAAQVNIDSLRCVGGGARSPMGLQLKADITGLPVHTLAVREAACLGAAMLAGLATGAYATPEEAAQVVRLDKTYLPRPREAAYYAERYPLYRALYDQNLALLCQL